MLVLSADQLESLKRANKKEGLARIVIDESLTEPGTLLVAEWYESGLCVQYAIKDNGKVKRV